MKHEAKNSNKPILLFLPYVSVPRKTTSIRSKKMCTTKNVGLILFTLTYFDWIDKEFHFPLYKKSEGGSDLSSISPNSVYKTNGKEIWFGIISINLLISTNGHLLTSTILC